MRRAPKPYPVVIANLVRAFTSAAKDHGVRGAIGVFEDGSDIAIVVRIPKGETVPARAMGA